MNLVFNQYRVGFLWFRGYWVAFDDPACFPESNQVSFKHIGKLFGLHWFSLKENK